MLNPSGLSDLKSCMYNCNMRWTNVLRIKYDVLFFA